MGYKCNICNHENFRVIKFIEPKRSLWDNIKILFFRLFGNRTVLTFKDKYICSKCKKEYTERDLIDLDLSHLPVYRNYYLMTKPENNFYQVLLKCIDDNQVIFPQVPLHAIVKSKNQSYRNRIDRKRLDFVIFSDKYYTPILVIELDDRSHEQPERRERDILVDKVLFRCNIPILHVKNTNRYETEVLKSQIKNKIMIWDYKRPKKR